MNEGVEIKQSKERECGRAAGGGCATSCSCVAGGIFRWFSLSGEGSLGTPAEYRDLKNKRSWMGVRALLLLEFS